MPETVVPSKYEWIKPGVRVDYHSVVGREVTKPGCRVRSEEKGGVPFQSASGSWVVFINGVSGYVLCDALTPAAEQEKGPFCISQNEEEFYGSFDSREEAVAESRSEFPDMEPDALVTVARCVPFVPSIDVEAVIDRLREEASEHAGEAAEDWLDGARYPKVPSKDAEELADLHRRLDAALLEWLKATDQYPAFYGCEDFTHHPAPPEEE